MMDELREGIASKEHYWVRPLDEKYDTRVCVKCGKRSAFYMHDKSECPSKEGVMSELREKIEAILKAGDMFLEPPEDMAEFIDKGAIKQSRADQILAAFKAHIEGCERPTPHEEVYLSNFSESCQLKGMEQFRKALMESLE